MLTQRARQILHVPPTKQQPNEDCLPVFSAVRVLVITDDGSPETELRWCVLALLQIRRHTFPWARAQKLGKHERRWNVTTI